MSATKDNIVEIADRVYEVTSYFDMPRPVVDAPKIIEFVACDQTLFKTEFGWDSDADGDLAYDQFDAFPDDPEEWHDNDGDGTGDHADLDDDDDNVIDSEDAFPLDASESKDSDDDGVGDNSDEFPADASESEDTDSDEVGNNADNCPDLANTDQLNTDGDSEGDACDFDDDNDGFTDEEELADGTNPLSRFSCRSGCFSFDIDENSEAKALTDGLLVIRHLFGLSLIHI